MTSTASPPKSMTVAEQIGALIESIAAERASEQLTVEREKIESAAKETIRRATKTAPELLRRRSWYEQLGQHLTIDSPVKIGDNLTGRRLVICDYDRARDPRVSDLKRELELATMEIETLRKAAESRYEDEETAKHERVCDFLLLLDEEGCLHGEARRLYDTGATSADVVIELLRLAHNRGAFSKDWTAPVQDDAYLAAGAAPSPTAAPATSQDAGRFYPTPAPRRDPWAAPSAEKISGRLVAELDDADAKDIAAAKAAEALGVDPDDDNVSEVAHKIVDFLGGMLKTLAGVRKVDDILKEQGVDTSWLDEPSPKTGARRNERAHKPRA